MAVLFQLRDLTPFIGRSQARSCFLLHFLILHKSLILNHIPRTAPSWASAWTQKLQDDPRLSAIPQAGASGAGGSSWGGKFRSLGVYVVNVALAGDDSEHTPGTGESRRAVIRYAC
jgi:hypothetical protein